MDFDRPEIVLPTHFSTLSFTTAAWQANQLAASVIGSYNWPAQEQAVYVPVVLPWDFPVFRIFVANGSSAGGNWDFGIYTRGDTSNGSAIFRTGEFAGSGNSQCQYFDVTDFLLPAGSYYFALTNDSATTTNRVYGISTVTANEGRVSGLLQEALGSGNSLKASTTFAQWASTGLPLCGITRTTSGF